MAERLPLFPRDPDDRIIAGVAGGLGRRLGVEPFVLRLAAVVLGLAGGIGIGLYLLAWVVSGEQGEEPSPPRAPSGRSFVAVWVLVAGVLLIVRSTVTLWPGDAIMLSAALGGFGSALLWTRGESGGRIARLARRLPAGPADSIDGLSRTRIGVAGVLVLAGMTTFLAANTSVAALRNVVFAVVVTVAGFALLFGPWIDQLVRQLRQERTERIRSEERAEVAAHLHDSVLQTLALIQRARGPQEMASLARVQERELRSWLYGRMEGDGPAMLSGALEEMAGRIERLHQIAVESVLVGDVEMDDGVQALVDAAGEAVTNAAKHAGVASVAVYCEVEDAEITLYVRDEGRGFEPAALSADRRGIAGSIIDRMERNGGTASITSAPDRGTEVHLALPRRSTA